MILENALDADAGVDSALLRGRQVGFGSGNVLGGEKSAATDGYVKLLGMSETGKEQKKSKDRQRSSELHYSSELYSGELCSGKSCCCEPDSGELSQIQPP
jgi:hypothetical protein